MKHADVLKLIDDEEKRLRLEAERVEKRMELLRKHAGLFRLAIRRARLEWIEGRIPEDFSQERFVFFLDQDTPEPPAREFLRAAQRHAYRVGVSYGFVKNNLTKVLGPREVPLSSLQFEEESYDEAQERLTRDFVTELDLAEEEGDERVDLSTTRSRRKVRAALAFRDGAWREKGKMLTWCGLCSQPLELRAATIDHILPRAQGGKDVLKNLQLAHHICNQAKGDRLPPLIAATLEAASKLRVRENEPARRVVLGTIAIADLSLKEIMEKTGKSRATAWRIRKNGYYWIGDYRHQGPRSGGGERVGLTSAEKKLPAYALMDRFGLSAGTAKETKKRGWFEVNDNNRSYIHIPEDRNLTEEEIGRLELPERIEVGPDGQRIAEMSSRELADAFDLSMKAALQIRKRGFVATRTWTHEKRRQVAGSLYQT